MIRFLRFLITTSLLMISCYASADVIFQDQNGQADHSIVLKSQGEKIFIFNCSLNGSHECSSFGKASGYSLKETLATLKSNIRIETAMEIFLWVLIAAAFLLAGGFTILTAAGVITGLASGALGTAAACGLAAILTGGNVWVLSKGLPKTIVDTKQFVQERKGLLNEGITNSTSYIIKVPNIRDLEDHLETLLPK
jgi:hypothetical protein